MPIPVGIDLGTTFSAVAVLKPGSDFPEILTNRDDQGITPSVIQFLDGEIIYGREAEQAFREGMPGCAATFKRLMGRQTVCITADGVSYTAEMLSAMLLAHLKEVAEEKLGLPLIEAIITVPAYFDSIEREATLAAAKQAGIKANLIDEPSAAALAYSAGQWRENASILVYDLGGGTFDVTLVRMMGNGHIAAIATSGDHTLGGRDWDERLADIICAKLEDLTKRSIRDNWATMLGIRGKAEEIKKQLSEMQNSRNLIPLPGFSSEMVSVSREEFEAQTKDLLERTGSLIQAVLGEAALSAADLSDIIMVGGSTRMPQVASYIEQQLGRRPLSFRPDEAVALGAAILASQEGIPPVYEPVRIVMNRGKAQTDRRAFGLSLTGKAGEKPAVTRQIHALSLQPATQHALGIIAENSERTHYINEIIIPANHPRPAVIAKGFNFHTRPGDANEMRIYVLQGDKEAPLENRVQYLYVVSGIRHLAESRGETLLRIQYSYDRNGVIQVEARQEKDNRNLPIRREPVPEDLEEFARPIERPPQQIQEMLALVMAIDVSGSMTNEPLAKAKEAMHGVVQQLDFGQSRVAIIAVSDRTQVVCELSADEKKIHAAIDSIRVGMTGSGNSGHPFQEIQAVLADFKGRRFAQVLADGVWSHQNRAIEAAKYCQSFGIETAAIGFGRADLSFLKAISSSDANAVFTNLANLAEAMASVVPRSQGQTRSSFLRDSRNQEVATWTPQEV